MLPIIVSSKISQCFCILPNYCHKFDNWDANDENYKQTIINRSKTVFEITNKQLLIVIKMSWKIQTDNDGLYLGY